MHVVMFASAPAFGGGEQYLIDLATGLIKRGHSVTVAVNGGIADEFRRRGVAVRVVHLGPKLSRRNSAQLLFFPFWLLYVLGWILCYRLRQPIDLLHCQYKKEEILVSIAARILRIRLIWTEHGPLPGFLARRRVLVAAYRWASQFASQVIAVSEATRQDLITHGLDQGKIKTIHNGVVVHPLAPGRRHPIPGRLLSIGRLIPGKGHSVLIYSMQHILREAPETHLIILGDGPLASALTALVRNLALDDHITFLGHVSREDVRREIERSVGVIMPSLPEVGGEGLPYAIVEAMERGCPVVATRTGGIPELVQDGKTGILVDDCTPEGFATHILCLLKDSERAQVFADNARSAVERQFSLSAMLDATERAFAVAAR
jgi:colanic acid/amylovoran biosynthesis glycosyltransferase